MSLLEIMELISLHTGRKIYTEDRIHVWHAETPDKDEAKMLVLELHKSSWRKGTRKKHNAGNIEVAVWYSIIINF